jgi:hypothetical protein
MGDRSGLNSWEGLKCWIDEKIDEKLCTIKETSGEGKGKGSRRKSSAKEVSVSPAQHKMILVSELRTMFTQADLTG